MKSNKLSLRRGQMEKSSITRDFPAAKTAYTFLRDNISSSFVYPGWNKGCIICQRPQLKRILSGKDSPQGAIKGEDMITLCNSPFPPERREPLGNSNQSQNGSVETETNQSLLLVEFRSTNKWEFSNQWLCLIPDVLPQSVEWSQIVILNAVTG